MEGVIKLTLETLDDFKEDVSSIISIFTNESDSDEENIIPAQNINLDRFNERLCHLSEKVSVRLDDFKNKSSKVAAATVVASSTFFDTLRVQNEKDQCIYNTQKPSEGSNNAKDKPKEEPETFMDSAKVRAHDFGIYSLAFLKYAACNSKKVFYAAKEAKLKFLNELHKSEEVMEDISILCPQAFENPSKEAIDENLETTEKEPPTESIK